MGVAQATANQYAETDIAGFVLDHVQADVMHADGCTIMLCAIDGDLELAWQEGELGMKGRPLANDLAPRARIYQFVGSNAGKLISRSVANAVAAGLNGVHLDFSQVRQNVGHIFECRPVELNVLARAEVGVAFVILAGNKGQFAHLLGRDVAIGNGNAQHRRVALYI